MAGNHLQSISPLWASIPCKISELCLDVTLVCGQSFRWAEISPGIWRSVLNDRVLTLKQTDTELLYQVHQPPEGGNPNPSLSHSSRGRPRARKRRVQPPESQDGPLANKVKLETEENDILTAPSNNTFQNTCQDLKPPVKSEPGLYHSLLRDYFQLDVNLGALYKQWSSADANFRRVAVKFAGVRILRQDPTENLFSFICSSNNNISRITSMVQKLCQNYGQVVGEVDGIAYHSFPTVAALAGKDVEQELRGLGFGYRAKYISQTARYIIEHHENSQEWFNSLRHMPYEEAHTELVKLCGVGAKVADCVCLMSMDKPGAIPVDTHVWQIAARDYMPHLKKHKTLTSTHYREIGDFFRQLFGHYAGWAHSVLFSADLKKFKIEGKKSKDK